MKHIANKAMLIQNYQANRINATITINMTNI